MDVQLADLLQERVMLQGLEHVQHLRRQLALVQHQLQFGKAIMEGGRFCNSRAVRMRGSLCVVAKQQEWR